MWEHHRSRKTVLSQHLGMCQHQAVSRPHRRHHLRGLCRQPGKHFQRWLILLQRQVIEDRVAAVEQKFNPARLQMLNDGRVGLLSNGPFRVTSQRRHRHRRTRKGIWGKCRCCGHHMACRENPSRIMHTER